MGILGDAMSSWLAKQIPGQVNLLTQKDIEDDNVGIIDKAIAASTGLTNYLVPNAAMQMYQGGFAHREYQLGAHAERPTLLGVPEAILAIRRGFVDGASIEAVKDSLRYAGWADDKIELLYLLSNFYPSPSEIISWTGRHVFDADTVSQLALEIDFDTVNLDLLAKSGVTKEQAVNFWIAHWMHISAGEMSEMLHRNEFGDDAACRAVFDLWCKINQIAPYWQQYIWDISFEVPPRYIVRYFRDFDIVSDDRLRQLWSQMGYKGQNLDDIVLWNKVSGDLPRLLRRYNNGWITIDDVKTALIADGASEALVTELMQENLDNTTASPVFSQLWSRYENGWITLDDIKSALKSGGKTDEQITELLQTKQVLVAATESKELTKSELIKAWHDGIIDEVTLHDDLVRLGYDSTDADIIEMINPMPNAAANTAIKLQALIEKVRAISGLDYVEISTDIIAEDDLISGLQAQIKTMQAANADPAEITTLQIQIEEEELKLRDLKALHGIT